MSKKGKIQSVIDFLFDGKKVDTFREKKGAGGSCTMLIYAYTEDGLLTVKKQWHSEDIVHLEKSAVSGR